MHTLFEFITYTKSVEYLIAVGFLVSFVVFWRFANGASAAPAPRTAAAGLAGRLGEYVGGFLLPESYFFHRGHAWVKNESGDRVAVGVDDFGQKLLGRIDAAFLPQVGAVLSQGERAWTLHANGKSIDMLAPIDGEVLAVNEGAAADPSVIQRDPYGKGWLLILRAPRKRALLPGLLSGMLAKHWLEEARGKLSLNSGYALGEVLADAGPARGGIAQALDPEHWDRLAREFFLTNEDGGDEARPPR
jgi:glycine cleavage system H lipoate-binding protein